MQKEFGGKRFHLEPFYEHHFRLQEQQTIEDHLNGGVSPLCRMAATVQALNPQAPDIRQPLDHPLLEDRRQQLEKESEDFRANAKEREKRLKKYKKSLPYIIIHLRRLSGQELKRRLRRVPRDYLDLQLGFGECFPWHRTLVCPEWPDGSAVHPQRAVFEPECHVHFREIAPTGKFDLLSDRLQQLPAGWDVSTHAPNLLSLPVSLPADEDRGSRHYLPPGEHEKVIFPSSKHQKKSKTKAKAKRGTSSLARL